MYLPTSGLSQISFAGSGDDQTARNVLHVRQHLMKIRREVELRHIHGEGSGSAMPSAPDSQSSAANRTRARNVSA